jgi:transforming growth factor-beta-induced protein
VATGLDGLLSERRQLTVFAPTDQAFLKLTGKATEAQAFSAVADLGLDAVADVLAYHVSPGRRTAASVVPAQRVKTLQGGFLTKSAGSATLVDALGRSATIVAPDAALVSNGVIHVIDTVVLPFAP